jgi:hypothetical protein
MTEDNWTERYRAIADHILSEGDYFSGPAPAPNPAEMGAPDYFEGATICRAMMMPKCCRTILTPRKCARLILR